MGFFTSAEEFTTTIDEVYDKYHDSIDTPDLSECLEIEIVRNHYQHACLHTDLGNFSASLTYFERCLKAYRGAKNPAVSEIVALYTIYGGLGNSYDGLRQQVEAEKQYRECLDIMPRELKFSNYELNICRTLYGQGPQRYAEANDRVEDFIRRREAMYGPEDHVDYL